MLRIWYLTCLFPLPAASDVFKKKRRRKKKQQVSRWTFLTWRWRADSHLRLTCSGVNDRQKIKGNAQKRINASTGEQHLCTDALRLVLSNKGLFIKVKVKCLNYFSDVFLCYSQVYWNPHEQLHKAKQHVPLDFLMKLRESDDAEVTAVIKKNLCMTFSTDISNSTAVPISDSISCIFAGHQHPNYPSGLWWYRWWLT